MFGIFADCVIPGYIGHAFLGCRFDHRWAVLVPLHNSKLATTVPFEPDNVNRTTGLPIYTKVVEPKPHQWFLYIVMNMLLASAAFLLTRFITPQARGSGIPRMKGVLGGSIYTTFYLSCFVCQNCWVESCVLIQHIDR